MSESVNEKIKNQIENNNVILFMKGSRDMPMCGFSARVVTHIIKIMKPLTYYWTLK